MDLIASARHVAIACPQRVASLPWPYPIACMHACSRPSPRISLPWPSPMACMHACSRPSPTYRFPCRHSSRPCCVRRSGGSGSRRLAHEPFRSPQDESSIGRCRQRGSSIQVIAASLPPNCPLIAANVGAAFRSVLLEGGPAALMRGAGMQVLITAPSSPHRSVLLEGGPAALMRGAGMRVFWIAPQVC